VERQALDVSGPDHVGEYNRLLEADARAAREQAEWLHEAFARASVTFGDAPMRSFLRPHLLSRRDWDALRAQGSALLEIAARVARSAFGGELERLCAFLGTPEAELRWLRPDPGQPDVVLSRLDAFLAPDGPRFIEINSDAPAGFGYGDRMAEVFRELPVFRRFAAGRRLEYVPSAPRLVDAVLGLWRARGGSAVPSVAIVDWADVRTRSDQEILREAFHTRGVRCVLADPRALELRQGRLLGPDGRIDVVYRRGVLSELLEREDEVRPFLEAYRDGAALYVNSLRCRLSEDKVFFALLTDEAFADLMSADERSLVARVVPWTRRLEERRTRKDGREIDLIPYVIERREELVLKPAHAYGGRSVLVGDETPAEAWAGAVRAGLGSPWVVQQRVTIPEEVFPVLEDGRLELQPLKVNVNPFYVAGAEVGAVTRASRQSVINVSAGGGSVPVFVVD
jgi:hypothetical protein